jgi:hypothetical protein
MPEEDPPDWAGEVDREAVDVAAEMGELSSGSCPADGVSPLTAENPAKPVFHPKLPPDPRLRPAKRSNPVRNRTESPAQTSSETPSSNGPGRGLSNPQPRRLFKKANANALIRRSRITEKQIISGIIGGDCSSFMAPSRKTMSGILLFSFILYVLAPCGQKGTLPGHRRLLFLCFHTFSVFLSLFSGSIEANWRRNPY